LRFSRKQQDRSAPFIYYYYFVQDVEKTFPLQPVLKTLHLAFKRNQQFNNS